VREGGGGGGGDDASRQCWKAVLGRTNARSDALCNVTVHYRPVCSLQVRPAAASPAAAVAAASTVAAVHGIVPFGWGGHNPIRPDGVQMIKNENGSSGFDLTGDEIEYATKDESGGKGRGVRALSALQDPRDQI